KAFQGGDPEPVHAPVTPGQLVPMAAVLDDYRLLDECHRPAAADAQPQVVVLAGGQALVEPAKLDQDVPAHHRRRRRYHAQRQTVIENPAAALPVPAPLVNPNAVADPDLL